MAENNQDNKPAEEKKEGVVNSAGTGPAINMKLEPDEPMDNNPTLKDLMKKSDHISRMSDKALINETAGASVSIRENGQIRLNQVTALRTQMQMGAISQQKMIAVLNNSLPGRLPSPKLTFTDDGDNIKARILIADLVFVKQ